MTSEKIVKLSPGNFKEKVLEAKEPVLVDFWAAWCHPCQMIAPTLEEIADKQEGLRIGKLNVDENPDLASNYKVMSIPTLILFNEGKEAKRLVGALPKQRLIEELGPWLPNS